VPFTTGGLYSGNAYVFGLPTRTGALSLTATLHAVDGTGDIETVTATMVGDHVVALAADCWIQTKSVGAVVPCSATRNANGRGVAAPIGTTGDHGAFRLSDVDDDPFNPASSLPAGGHYTSRPDVTPASFQWASFATDSAAGLAAAFDGNTTAPTVGF